MVNYLSKRAADSMGEDDVKGRASQHAGEPLLRLSDVHLTFDQGYEGAIRVLRDITVTVKEHEVLGILGQSGCGKTSLLQVMSGLIRPTSGEIVYRPGLVEARGIAVTMVFQKPTLVPWYTVEENVFLPYRLAGLPVTSSVKERADRLFRLVRLQGFRSFHPHTLSGGMQMRVALVRAFLTEPQLILMDEPFSALDETTRLDLSIEMLGLVTEAKSSVVFVTHSVQEAALVSDRILLMSPRPGRIVSEVFSPFKELRTQELIGRGDFVDFCVHLRAGSPHAHG